jgi:hypothetical protein
MRIAALTAIAAIGFAGAVLPAQAAPILAVPAHTQASAVVEISGGCGRAWHRDRWGRCVPRRYGYYRPYRYGYAYWAPYWPGYAYADGHEPWNRPTPRDRVANRLNRQELRGFRY